MRSWSCEIEGANIVLLGSFNPSIFQPAWLAAHRLIRDEESEAAKIEIIRPEVSSFTAGWLQVEVTQERFQASTADAAHYEPLRDLVLGVFAILEHTPFDKMGINRHMHYRVEAEKQWHAFGDFLVPKAAWRTVLSSPGLRSLTVEGRRGEAEGPRIQVKVEPSVRVHPGVFIATNEHHEASAPDAARRLMTILRDAWNDSQAYAKHLAETMLDQKF